MTFWSIMPGGSTRRHGHRHSIERIDPAPESGTIDLLALDAALTELDTLEPRLCRVVELKFFAGLNIAETASALDISDATVERDWVVARTWLHQRLSS